MTELERSERYPEILDLELNAGTDGTLGVPFAGGEYIFIYMKKLHFLALEQQVLNSALC